MSGMAFRSYAEHQHQNGPGGGTEAVNLPKGGLLPRLGGVLFWGAENLSLMSLMVPMPITINLGSEIDR